WLGTARRNAAAPENRSSTLFPGGIPLVAGQMYYFEALMKEGGGGDNLAFTWQAPGDPIPASGSPELGGAYLATLADGTGVSIAITQQPADQKIILNPSSSTPGILWSEELNAGDGGMTVNTPQAFPTAWTYEGASGSWRVDQEGAEIGFPMTTSLRTPPLTVTKSGSLRLEFAHRYSMEGGDWDGGQVRVSINGGAFTAVPRSAFSQGAYNGTVLGNSRSVLAGQNAFVGDSPNHQAPAFVTSIADLGFVLPGDTVVIEFLYAGDTNTRGNFVPSWQIDRILVTEGISAQQPARFTVAASATVPGSPNQAIFYQWDRDCGSGFAPIPGANSATLSFPVSLADHGCRVRCRAYVPGGSVTSREALLEVVQPNTPPVFTKAGGDQTVAEDAGPQTVPGFLTGIAAHSFVRNPVVYGGNFDSLPPGATLMGNAAVADGVLKLTVNANSQAGVFVTPNAPGLVESFEVTFRALIGGGTCCGDRTADGWSFSFGNDLTLPPAINEEGTGTGLIVSFDSWDNTGIDDAYTAPNVDIKAGGVVKAYQAFDGLREGGRPPSGPFITDPATMLPMTYKTGDQFTDVRIRLEADGTMDVDFKGVRVLDNVATGYRPLDRPQIALAARTGGANDNHWIDDLLIVAYPPDASSAEAGQTVQFLVSNDNPSLFSAQPAISPNGTLTYTPAPNACGSAVVTVVAMDNGGTADGGRDSSQPCTFNITVTCVCDAPTAVADAASTQAGTPVTIAVLANDLNIEGSLGVAAVTQGSQGS
ncbi:MAG TPA: hypothetical protein VNO52_07755, partial [Methylomirabilota bacterium]|nr:hypothetical protein [Methylomirabilota bacterium]